MVGVGHGLSRAYARLPEVRTARFVLLGGVAAAVLLLPVFGSDTASTSGR